MDYSEVPNVLASYALGLRTLTVSFRDFTANATTRLGEVFDSNSHFYFYHLLSFTYNY